LEYTTPETARSMSGLRLALTTGVPAPYSMSARTILDLKGVAYIPVAQVPAGHNEALKAWTGHRNAPTAVLDDEGPRTGWLDILNLAERLGSGAPLLPNDVHERMLMIGLANELIGENGFLWLLRIVMFGFGGPDRAAKARETNPMFDEYGYDADRVETALQAAKVSFEVFATHAKTHAHPHYLIGDRLSALDIYWAYFSQLRLTLPAEACPMPGGMRRSYEKANEVLGPCDPALIERRDFIFREHIGLPLDF